MCYENWLINFLGSGNGFWKLGFNGCRLLSSLNKNGDWRDEVANNHFILAWYELEGTLPKSCLVSELADLGLEKLVLDPVWGPRYEAFRLWVWQKNSVWLLDSWSLAVACSSQSFSSKALYMINSSHDCFNTSYWLLDVEFMVMGSSGGSLAPRRVEMFSNEGILRYSGSVSGASELVSEIASFSVYMCSYIEYTKGAGDGKWSGVKDLIVFIPSPGSVVFVELAVHLSLAQLAKLGISVEKNEEVMWKGCLVSSLIFTVPGIMSKVYFKGLNVAGDLDVSKVDLSYWFL